MTSIDIIVDEFNHRTGPGTIRKQEHSQLNKKRWHSLHEKKLHEKCQQKKKKKLGHIDCPKQKRRSEVGLLKVFNVLRGENGVICST